MAGAALLLAPVGARAQRSAQESPKIATEARTDAIISSNSAVHAGLGFTTPAGTYLRTGLVAAAGASENGISGRIDFVNRFHLDPFRESRWAPYAGGGLSSRFDNDRQARFYLLVFAGVDGPATRGRAASVEAGLGGGGRISVIIRRAAAKRR